MDEKRGRLIFIGLGLSGFKDLSLKAIEALKRSDEIYFESYTNFVDETTNQSSLWALFTFSNSSDLQTLIENQIRPIKGIQEIESYLILDYYVPPPLIHERIH